jgi:hypothetical protein
MIEPQTRAHACAANQRHRPLRKNINRHGFVEETHFTVAYSPVPDETARWTRSR